MSALRVVRSRQPRRGGLGPPPLFERVSPDLSAQGEEFVNHRVERCPSGPPSGMCSVCGSRTRPGFDDCYCCHHVRRQLGLPLVPVVTVTDYMVGDPLHRLLRGYKDGPSAPVRSLRARAVAARVGEWLARGGDRLVERLGGWDLVTVVPSVRRAGAAPAEALVILVPQLAACYRPLLVRGPAPTDHLLAARYGFVLAPGVERDWLRGQRVLIFDDSLTTGARAQSAAFTLRRAGGLAVGVLAVGRARRASSRAGCGPDQG